MRPAIMLYALAIGALLLLAACQPADPLAPVDPIPPDDTPTIDSFEDCIAAGNPAMESYPRQCRAGDRTFTEEIGDPDHVVIPDDTFHACTEDEKQNRICTREYRPVCAAVDNGIRCITAPCPSADFITKSTGCTACADQAYSYYQGACEDLRFVVCEGKTSTGLSAEEFARDTGAICVDICPDNHDPYMTQIGIKVCTQHYGDEEIEDWPVCERSSDSCGCVNAYETTRGEPIEDPEYRCVPERYAGRLIFTGGVDRLDDDGERSVAIA